MKKIARYSLRTFLTFWHVMKWFSWVRKHVFIYWAQWTSKISITGLILYSAASSASSSQPTGNCVVQSSELWDRRPSFFWRGWISSYSNICSVCGDVKELSYFWITLLWSWPQDVVVPARWWNSPYCQHMREGGVRNVSGPGCFKRRRHFIACTFPWHLSVWLLSLG